jgi:hypothetical protein
MRRNAAKQKALGFITPYDDSMLVIVQNGAQEKRLAHPMKIFFFAMCY